MKKTFIKMIYAAGAVLVFSTMQSCNTEKLTDLNKNPNAIEYVIPDYSFTAAVLASGPGENYRPLGQGLQYFSSYKEVPATGDKFYNFSGTAGNFNIYTGQWNRLLQLTKQNVFGNADPYFKGDVAKWKKFGYTLMLRLGMRLSDIEPATAKAWVEKAVAGGVMTASTDIAYLKYANVTGQFNPRVNGYINGDFTSPGGDNIEGSKWSGKFIDHLKNTSDPRLPVLSVVWVPTGGTYTPNNTPATQRGMVNGSINTRPTDFDTYSEPSLLYIDRGSPIITMGPAEAYLIIAEAAARGWSVGTTAQAAYDNGVRAAMAQWALWPSVAPHSGVITSAQVDAYLLANPYPAAGTFAQQLEVISTQKWVSMLGDDYEVFSNWRRTKYPVFNYANWTNTAGQKVTYPGNVTAGKMWRRFSLPIAERNVNPDNYYEAIKRQNYSEQELDLLQGRMWWDVGPGTGQSN